MRRIRFLTAGESHGPGLVVILEGIPAGLGINGEEVNRDLARRQVGYGRGARMSLEKDRAEITGGVRHGYTLGSPLALLVRNRDWENWQSAMAISSPKSGDRPARLTTPRPGHADLPGALKFSFPDLRNVIERSSARETAVRVAAGAVARRLLSLFNINIYSRVIQVGPARDRTRFRPPEDYALVEKSPLRCLSRPAEKKMAALIDRAKETGDSLGGVFQVVATGLPVGLGSYTQWDLRLDGRLAQGLMSIPGVKGVEVGAGFKTANRGGSRVHDEIFHIRQKGYYRKTNNAGGLEGGITNGENLLLQAVMKPIPTLARPLRTVDLDTKEPATALKERSDVCAVPAAGIIGEAMAALILADAFLEKTGGDSVSEIKRHLSIAGDR